MSLDPLVELCRKDAYSVLPPQPLGDYLQAIVETLKKQEDRIEALEAKEEKATMRVESCEDEIQKLIGSVDGIIHTTSKDTSVTRLANLEEGLRELQGTRFGDEYSGDARLVAIERDLRRAVDHEKTSDPAGVVLDMDVAEFYNAGGKPAFREAISGKLGIPITSVQVMQDPTSTDEGRTKIVFRIVFSSQQRESAEGLCASLMGRFAAGSAGGVLNAPVRNPTRPNFAMVSPKLCLAKTVDSLTHALLSTMNHLRRSEFWLHHASYDYTALKTFKKNRWKGKEPHCVALSVANTKVLLSKYYRRLFRYIVVSKKQKARTRALKYLSMHTSAGLAKVYHKKCLNWLANAKISVKKGQKGSGVANNLLLATTRGARLRCYKAWKKFASRRRAKRGMIDNLALVNTGVLKAKYFSKLARYKDQGLALKRRNIAIHAMSVMNCNILRSVYYKKLANHVKIMQKRRKKRAVQNKFTNELHRQSLKSHAKHAFKQLSNFSRIKSKEREREMLSKITQMVSTDANEDRCSELSKKCDSLGTQVDVSLKTLTNTNSVLNKLVDRLISVDEQLDHLDREKVSRKDLKELGPQQPLSQPTSDTAVTAVTSMSSGGVSNRNISPPRMNSARTSSTINSDPKEAEQWRLLQKEKARLAEVTSTPPATRWDSYPTAIPSNPPSYTGLPSTEDTLSRARQWQKDRANLTPLRDLNPNPPSDTSLPPGWRIT
eukprot:TRINITY_DN11651_c1_g1_i1.p1 TRINITY_DN11651_c1_g1~~TRINITY_DN11651_c1_g1_i1.p1  ORF type:complete len:718 (+),score=114.00 TRINITY_DN11651_c1_g1_i1:61-2214(+)